MSFKLIFNVYYKTYLPLLNSLLFVCLFFLSHSRIFHSYGDVAIAGEGLQTQWPLSSEGSSACHNYCDTGHPSIRVISEDP